MGTAAPKLPSISIVIASGAGGDFLFRLLDALEPQVRAEAAELIVPDRVGGATADRLRRDYPWVQLVPVPNGSDGRKPSVPALRAEGAARATGEIVAIIEEHCRPPAGWLRAIREEFRADDAAISGPMLDDGWRRRRDWVVYFSEYHNFLAPWSDDDRELMNGANIAYRRALLEKHRDVLRDGYWDVALHPRLRKDGRLRGVQRVGAHHTGPFDFRYYLGQRYLLARVWGAMRRDKVPGWYRLMYLAGAPLFPFLLLARIANRVRHNGRFVRQFVMTLPLLVPVAFVYVFGEWSGYAFGFGTALEDVE